MMIMFGYFIKWKTLFIVSMVTFGILTIIIFQQRLFMSDSVMFQKREIRSFHNINDSEFQQYSSNHNRDEYKWTYPNEFATGNDIAHASTMANQRSQDAKLAMKDLEKLIDSTIEQLQKLKNSVLIRDSVTLKSTEAEKGFSPTEQKKGIRKIRNHESSWCPKYPENLDSSSSIKQRLDAATTVNKTVLQSIKYGGSYSPPNCVARERVAVIVPYRDREQHLNLFLNHMHGFLQKQQLQYTIFVIEMALPTQFNRGLLANVGYINAESTGKFTCFIIHDVDLLPMNETNLYHCSNRPRHLSIANSKYKYKLPYDDFIGGIVALRKVHYSSINGFSNLYFGWGAEDDDLHDRLKAFGLVIERPAANVGIYYALQHKTDTSNPKNPIKDQLYANATSRIHKDGLDNVSYSRLALEFRELYTWIYVKTNEVEIMKNYSDITVAPRSKFKRQPVTAYTLNRFENATLG